MLNQIVQCLKIIADNKTEEEAIVNVLNAKLANLFGFKGVTFNSISNLSTAYPISYYAVNIVPSGGSKNILINEIENNLMPFFDDECKELQKKRYDKYDSKFALILDKITDKNKKKAKEREFNQLLSDIKKEKVKKELADFTQAVFYKNARIINDLRQGSILFKITEFESYFEEAIKSPQSSKKTALLMTLNLFDGHVDYVDTVSTSREEQKNIPFSLIFMSTMGDILDDDKVNLGFKKFLKRGFARRTFFYINKDLNYVKDTPVLPTISEKEQAVKLLKQYGEKIKEIYNKIPVNQSYIFNTECNEAIIQWKNECSKKTKSFYKSNISYLPLEKDILEKEIDGSQWKIIKLAVVYHILENPESSLIKIESFNQAKNFYLKSYKNLESLLNKKPPDSYDKLYAFFVENTGKWITRKELEQQKFIPDFKNNFKKWFEDTLPEIITVAEQNGCSVVEEQYHKNGAKRYKLVESNIGKSLDKNIKSLDELVGI